MLNGRRALLQCALLGAALPALALQRRALAFPRDFGAHPETGIEWWYLTGLLGERADSPPLYGYQLTFFRVRNADPAVQAHPSALAPRQLLLGHIALSDLRGQRLHHEQRLARAGLGGRYAEDDCDVALQDWQLLRLPDDSFQARFVGAQAAFGLQLTLHSDGSPLLQGEAGYSRKGPGLEQASCYYSRPQLRSQATLQLEGRSLQLQGRSWLDHEWSDSLLAPEAVGWDWLGLNLFDGSALTLFRLRRADGSSLWTGGSWRSAGGRGQRNFADGELRFSAGRVWRSPRTRAAYPVAWDIATPLGAFQVEALFDAQEIDARASTGMAYWEGAARLRDAQGRALGQGYLEMTGYTERMRLR